MPAAAVPGRKQCSLFLLPLFIAGLSGAIIALLGNNALQQAGFYPGSAQLPPPAAPVIAAETGMQAQAAAAEIEALFAQKAQQLDEQTAQAAQILQDIAHKTAQIQQNRPQNSDEAPITAAESAEFKHRLAHQAREQAANNRALAALKEAIIATQRRNQEILFKTNALREEVALLDKKQRQAQNGAAQLLALQSLQTAFASGAPYAAELQIFGAAMPQALNTPAAAFMPAEPEQKQGNPQRETPKQEPGQAAGQTAQYPTMGEALARYQAGGLPNKAVLARDFTLLADRLAAQGADAEQSGNLRQSWQNRLARWITVRPQGKTGGLAAGAVLARMETALTEGDYKTALGEAAALPPQAQAAAKPYMDIIRLRLAANAFFRQAAQAVFSPARPAADPVSGSDIMTKSGEETKPHTP
ncbi:MAG: hypothetical protein DU430_02080 [Candidatus Tokpelaia sp.]|nr:MAG: hypothetical protein DU430_02080 [Candidatus Tokpelaia sp.]